jgi:glycosyltransferase involved in cell wall biosynthesis
MKVLLDPEADIRWRYLPRLYFWLEDFLLPKLQSVFCVREDAVLEYKRRHPSMAERFRFTPTWVDSEVFHPLDEHARAVARQELRAEFGFDRDDKVLISVGRLDAQKNPLMLLEAFRTVLKQHSRTKLILIGDGALRSRIEEKIADWKLDGAVVLAGLRPQRQIARYLQAADVFVLSSNYEGMPMSLLEALGSGIPVATTNVGEVGRVVRTGENGCIAAALSSAAMADAITDCLDKLAGYSGEPCLSAVKQFGPADVLRPLYENYVRLARASEDTVASTS